MSIFDKRTNYKPFEYPEVLSFIDIINKSYWVHNEVDFTADIQDYHANLDYVKREIHKRSILSIAQTEVVVKPFWGDLHHTFPKPELNGLGVSFAECEFRHSEAYSQILTINGYEDEFTKALENPIFKSYHDSVRDVMSNKDNSIIEKLLFFALVIEDSSLFSKFANILSFTRFDGLMKNTANIIAWTATDEQCFHKDTEVLTPNGWVLLRDMNIGDEVYGYKEGKLFNDIVLNKTHKKSNKLIKIFNKRHNTLITEGHDMIQYKISDNKWYKYKAKDVILNNRYKTPTTVDFTEKSEDYLSDLDRVKIAIQADGHKTYWTNKAGDVLERGLKNGYNYHVSLYKERKISRFRSLIKNTDLKWCERKITTKGRDGVQFSLHLEYLKDYKDLSWIKNKHLNKKICEDIINEALLWDGHISKNEKCYCSTNKSNIDTMQMIAILAGYRTNIHENNDSNRKETFKNTYKLSLTNKDQEKIYSHSYKKEEIEYNDDVFCINVKNGGLVTRINDSVFISGNCHANAGIWLLNTIKNEGFEMPNQEWINKKVKSYIEQESKMLDWIFELGELPYYTKQDLLNYMKFRLDESIVKIGYEKVFNESMPNKLQWFEEEIFSNSLDDFFAKRVVDYTKHDKSITANDLF